MSISEAVITLLAAGGGSGQSLFKRYSAPPPGPSRPPPGPAIPDAVPACFQSYGIHPRNPGQHQRQNRGDKRNKGRNDESGLYDAAFDSQESIVAAAFCSLAGEMRLASPPPMAVTAATTRASTPRILEVNRWYFVNIAIVEASLPLRKPPNSPR